LILTSAYEGLPIVIMDMMARGKIVLSTAVDGIPDYITHLENGMLITEKDETKIVQQGVELLRLLLTRPDLKREMERRSYQYALRHFSGETFCHSYRKFLLDL
jgi:glycosyltransferase involved in cell wall biosynthesis